MCSRCSELGRLANSQQRHLLALAFFESAFNVKEDAGLLISAINMRLKAGQCTIAAALYTQLLHGQHRSYSTACNLSGPQRELVLRKLTEANEAIEARARAAQSIQDPTAGADDAARILVARRRLASDPSRLEDEVTQLVAPLPRGELREKDQRELETLVQLLRDLGQHANRSGDCDAAVHFFDACFAVSRQPADLLSAANMRVRLEPMSNAAEALYELLLGELSPLDGRMSTPELQTAARKLEALRHTRQQLR